MKQALEECVQLLELVQSLERDGYRLRPAEKAAIAKSIKDARRLLTEGEQ